MTFVLGELPSSELLRREGLELLVRLIALLKKLWKGVSNQLLEGRVKAGTSENDRCTQKILLI
jgi:hypothetical protein